MIKMLEHFLAAGYTRRFELLCFLVPCSGSLTNVKNISFFAHTPLGGRLGSYKTQRSSDGFQDRLAQWLSSSSTQLHWNTSVSTSAYFTLRASSNSTVQFTWSWLVMQLWFCVKVHKYVVCFSDAFDLQYGVGVLRMRERLDVSQPSQLHGEQFLYGTVWKQQWDELFHLWFFCCANVLRRVYVVNVSVHISVNSGFNGSPENIHIISAAPRIKTSTTCT